MHFVIVWCRSLWI